MFIHAGPLSDALKNEAKKAPLQPSPAPPSKLVPAELERALKLYEAMQFQAASVELKKALDGNSLKDAIEKLFSDVRALHYNTSSACVGGSYRQPPKSIPELLFRYP